jgi:uncharacterized membrane protein YoaK (UPF0700 family)
MTAAQAQTMREQRERQSGPIALAACAGAVDLLALTLPGGVFASIITGNLVTLGHGIGTEDLARVVAVVIAVTGFSLGVVVWARLWRSRPAAVVGPLAMEMVVLIGLAAGLLAAGSAPGTTTARMLLALAAVAMGGQSMVGMRLRTSTTYLTGAFATALGDAVAGRRAALRPALVQLAALVTGAAVTALLITHLRWAAPLLPLVLVGAAMVLVHRSRSQTPDPAAAYGP